VAAWFGGLAAASTVIGALWGGRGLALALVGAGALWCALSVWVQVDAALEEESTVAQNSRRDALARATTLARAGEAVFPVSAAVLVLALLAVGTDGLGRLGARHFGARAR
jgi:hypothetical protein